jgi:ABC-2 type transport system ATP-binding protein
MEPVIELERLEKVYRPDLLRRSVPALKGLDMTVSRGEIYGFVGPNGAGKTTAFKIILGLLRPSGGRGRILGRPLGHPEARRGLGYLPELPAYYPHLTAGELLRFARSLSGVARDDPADRSLLEQLGLEGAETRSLRRLSKGQLQRVGLAQALVHDPPLLILDEPMSGLDPLGRSLVRERLRQERVRGRTIVISSHVLADVEALADTIGLLSDGRLLAEGPAAALFSDAGTVAVEGSGTLPGDILAGMPEGSAFKNDHGAWSLSLVEPQPRQVDACLRRALRAGAHIIRVETSGEDLESFFLRRLREEKRECRG